MFSTKNILHLYRNTSFSDTFKNIEDYKLQIKEKLALIDLIVNIALRSSIIGNGPCNFEPQSSETDNNSFCIYFPNPNTYITLT